MEEQIKILNELVVDRITGFTGRVTGIAFYTDRVTECFVESFVGEKEPVSDWIPFTRLTIIED